MLYYLAALVVPPLCLLYRIQLISLIVNGCILYFGFKWYPDSWRMVWAVASIHAFIAVYHARNGWRNEPATAKQKRYIEDEIGDDVEGLTKGQASDIITRYQKSEPATDEQRDFLIDLGYEPPKRMNLYDASQMIDKLKTQRDKKRAEQRKINKKAAKVKGKTKKAKAKAKQPTN